MTKLCTNCQKPLAENVKFCLNCGTPVQNESSDLVEKQPVAKQKRTSTKMSLPKKIGIGAAIFLLVGLVAAHFFIKNYVDPQKKLNEMNAFYTKQDYSAFLNEFTIPENTVTDAKSFYDYVESLDWKVLRDELNTTTKQLMNSGTADFVTNGEGEKIISVYNEPFLFFYNKVKYKLIPVTVTATTNASNAILNVASKDIELSSTDQTPIGSYIPGNYPYNVKIATDYGEIILEETLYINASDVEIDATIETEDILIESDIPEATLVINGTNSGKSVQETNILLGVPTNANIELYAVSTDEGGNEVTSEKITVDSSEVYLPFAHIQKQREEDAAKQKAEQEAIAKRQEQLSSVKDQHESDVYDYYYSFRRNYEYALNEIDPSYITFYFVDGSKIKQEFVDFIYDQANTAGVYYNFLSNSITKSELIDEKTFSLTANETFEYSDINGEWHYDRIKRYTIQISGNDYRILNVEDVRKSIKTKIR